MERGEDKGGRKAVGGEGESEGGGLEISEVKGGQQRERGGDGRRKVKGRGKREEGRSE